MPEGDLRIGQAPAEPDLSPVPFRGEIDQPHLDVSKFDPETRQVDQERPHPLPDLPHLGLAPAPLDGRGRVAVRLDLAVHLGVRGVEPPLLHGQLQQDRPHLGDQCVGFLDREASSCLGHRADGSKGSARCRLW